jgi:release factor glutamine methyltransferase
MSEKRWTVVELLRWTTGYFADAGIETARLDAECLLAHALGCERLSLYLDFDKPVEVEERDRFRELVKRRAADRIPVAHLVGHKEFWSLRFEVTPDVLVPRPDTETLVQAALECLPDVEAEWKILDLGTGSGAVAAALATDRPKARVVASDISQAALDVAARNAERLGLGERIHCVCGDGIAAVLGERFDLVVSNPPYLATDEAAGLAPELAHEPRHALFAGARGTEVLTQIVSEVGSVLLPGGAVALETASSQAEEVAAWFSAGGFEGVELHRDLAGQLRAVSARTARPI